MLKNSGSGLRRLWLLKNFKGSKRFKDTLFKRSKHRGNCSRAHQRFSSKLLSAPCTCYVSLECKMSLSSALLVYRSSATHEKPALFLLVRHYEGYNKRLNWNFTHSPMSRYSQTKIKSRYSRVPGFELRPYLQVSC
jgi:hypothetical protein